MHGQALFEKVVSLCGVSAVLAPGLVRRALGDGNISVESATVADYKAALPRLLARLRAYMPEEEAQKHARRIAGLLASIELGRGAEGESEDAAWAARVREILHTPPTGIAGRAPVRADAHVRSQMSAELASASKTPAAVPEFDDDVTLEGRRWTADEERRLREVGQLATADGDASSGGSAEPRKRGGSPELRRTRS
jgi:hypothetical protein